MQWPVLVGRRRVRPIAGRWPDWKQQIADQCDGRCVYCAIGESRFGGIRNFHVEHFRPKKRFEALENEITNLYLACAICNVLKGDDWPADPAADHSVATYPDPALTDYNKLLSVSPTTHEVAAVTLSGKYMIERVLLNRAQLVLERRLSAAVVFLSDFEAWVHGAVGEMSPEELRDVIDVLVEVSRARTTALAARPYRDSDAKRQVRAKARKKR